MNPETPESAVPAAALSDSQLITIQKIAALQEAMLKEHPNMGSLLSEIHRNLHKDPELCHFLTPEQVGVITSSAMRVTKTMVTSDIAKKIMKGGNKNLSMDF